MKKTILGLNEEFSIVILSGVGLLFVLLSVCSPMTNIISFALVLLKHLVFSAIPIYVYSLEKECLLLKKVAGIYTGYFIFSLVINISGSLFFYGSISLLWKVLFDLINLLILLCSILIAVEKLLEYKNMQSKLYKFTIMKMVYLIGDFISHPFLIVVDKVINKKNTKCN